MADLTIIMPSWNKEKYIAEALDSILAQKTTYSYHIVVADDHSTDRTLEIVREYSGRHPGFFTVLESDVNQKLFRNVRRAYALCKTPYFCVLDPDDFWTDDHHIQRALDYLEGHADYTIYCSAVETLAIDGVRADYGLPQESRDSTFEDFAGQRAVLAPTQTCVYRNVVFAKGLPELVANPPQRSMERSFRGDSFRNFIHLREGKAHYEPVKAACYRQTPEGVYAGMTDFGRDLLNAQLLLDLWQYDGRRLGELVCMARYVYLRARGEAFEDLLKSVQSGRGVRTELERLVLLKSFFDENEAFVDKCVMAGLSLRRRIFYRCYRKLRRKGLV